MAEDPELERWYAEAREAISRGELGRASTLLKRILAVDEGYADASRRLARLVARQRRRWYTDRRLWGVGAAVAALGGFLVLRDRLPEQALAPPTGATTPATPAPAQSATLPTSIPLTWTRIYHGGMFTRDQVTAIVVDPNDSDVLYVGTKNGGIYRSIDGGLSWRPAHNGLETASTDTLAIDPVDTRTLYAGTFLGGVYTTEDGGENWRALNQGISVPTYWSATVSVIALDPFDSQHLYYLDLEHIYEARAGRDIWQAVFSQDGSCEPFLQDMAVHPLQPRTLIVAEAGHFGCSPGIDVLDTEDGSRTPLLRTEEEGDWTLGLDSLSGSHLYASIGANFLYSSSDGGMTWAQQSNPHCTSIAVSPANGEVAYCASEDGLQKTSDAGKTWHAVSLPAPEQQGRTDIFVKAEDRRLFLGLEGLYVSQNEGTSWEPRQNGLGGAFLQLRLRPNHSDLLYIEEGSCGIFDDTNLFVSRDGGSTWALETDQGCGAAFSLDGEVIYRTDPSSPSLLRSPGEGGTWTTMSLSEGYPIYLSTLPPDLGALFVAFHDVPPVVSRNNGSSWVSTQLRENRLALAYDAQGEAIYAFAAEGSAYRSTNKGITWSRCARVDYWTSDIGSQFAAVHPSDSEHVLVGTRGGGVLVSGNGCRSWYPSNSGLGSLFVNALATDPASPDTIYAGTDGGAYVSFDGGVSWGEINDGLLGATVVYSIVVDPQSNVYAATPYGIFKLEGR